MEDAVTANSLGIKERVLAVRMADAGPMGFDHGQRIDSLPPEMTGIEVQPDVVADIAAKRIEAPGGENRNAGMQLEANHETWRLAGQRAAHLLPVRANDIGQLPVEKLLVIARGGPARENAQRPASGASRAAAHGDNTVDAQGPCKLDRGPQAALRVVAFILIGVENVAGSVDGGQAKAMFLKLARQPIALIGLTDRVDVEMWPRPRSPGSYSKLDVRHAPFCAPCK